MCLAKDYTIPSDNRELQHQKVQVRMLLNYTIPSDNRELQRRNYLQSIILIIPYQVITGNYNRSLNDVLEKLIIPYQVITGNYNITVNTFF